MSEEAPGSIFTRYIEKEILPLVPEKLLQFDKTLDEKGFPSRRYILFGSVVKSRPRRGSDIDVGVFIDSLEGVSVSEFYDLLGESGRLCRIKGIPLELTLFSEDGLESSFFENYREIDIESLKMAAETEDWKKKKK